MKSGLLFYLFFSLLFTFSCEKEIAHSPELPLSETITGDWLVVQQRVKESNFNFKNEQEGVITKWGCHYILNLTINIDGSYLVYNSKNKDQTKGLMDTMGGRWTMDGNNVIYFFCETDNYVAFVAYINKEGQLVLENKEIVLHHNKRQ